MNYPMRYILFLYFCLTGGNRIAGNESKNVAIAETADTTPPTITAAFIDYSTGTLRLQASEKLNLDAKGRDNGAGGNFPVSGDQVDLGKVFISNTNGATTMALTGATFTDIDSSEVTIVLTEAQRVTAIAISDTPGGGGATGDGSAIFIDIFDKEWMWGMD